MPIKTKGKVYKTAVRPAMLYGSECWAMKKCHEQTLHVNEMKMLRWAGGVTRIDWISNEYIRGNFKVARIQDKPLENRLRWYGHTQRRGMNYVVNIARNLPETPRGRGRPKSTWWSTIQKDLRTLNTTAETTQNREIWRKLTSRPDPT
ncbi:uncharacterized protein LOC123306651 [Coccinella septempunctata]|uniref:uncharacterized protein LOC123306651 n=1 Tax=Coccinella septempunctata TaxID=41139 RepID=UPI001D05FF35|nr:uncharacterized protein LOC123306651 [Coccinella septempunctata]